MHSCQDTDIDPTFAARHFDQELANPQCFSVLLKQSVHDPQMVTRFKE